jgi:hypothetical protein
MFKRWWKRKQNNALDNAPEQSDHPLNHSEEVPFTSLTSTEDAKPSIITINDQRYDLKQLPSDVLAMIEDVRMADAVIQLKRDRMTLLSIGTRQLGVRLRHALASVPELHS